MSDEKLKFGRNAHTCKKCGGQIRILYEFPKWVCYNLDMTKHFCSMPEVRNLSGDLKGHTESVTRGRTSADSPKIKGT